jgi:S-layer protein (TIGR01567 family)
MSLRALWLCIVLLIGLGTAADVPFVFGEGSSGIAGYTSAQIEQASIASPDLAGVPGVSSPSENEVLAFPVTGGGGNTSQGSTKEMVGDLKKAFDERTDTNNQYVLDEAALLAAKYPGDLTMDQICSIYSYLKNGDEAKKGWSYVRDRRGPDYYRYANESLKMGDRAGCSGVGDCDDFAILMSSLIESIGGTTRIILAHNNTTGGHAYTEVYLGNLNVQNNQVEGIASWLKQKFNADKIYTHIDTNAKDVWLNLDWGLDEKGIAHPGGPFFQGDKHIVLYIRDLYGKTALKLPEPPQEKPEQSSKRTPAEAETGATSNRLNEGGAQEGQIKYDESLQAYVTNVGVPKFTWDSTTFSGFYHDIDNNLGTETLTFSLSDARSDRALLSDQPNANGDRGVIYNTKAQLKKFKFKPWGQYQVIGFLGEGYFAAYDNTVTQGMIDTGEQTAFLYGKSKNSNLMSNEQISKILLDYNKEIAVSSANPLKLAEGYQLAIKSIDADGVKMYIELTKNGQVVDSKVVQACVYNITKISDQTYYHMVDLGDTKDIVQIAVHFKNAIRGADINSAIVDGIFQISDNAIPIHVNQQSDKMSISNVDPITMTITMSNIDNAITLSKNMDIILMQNIHIKTVNQDTVDDTNPLIYYIFSDRQAGELG